MARTRFYLLARPPGGKTLARTLRTDAVEPAEALYSRALLAGLLPPTVCGWCAGLCQVEITTKTIPARRWVEPFVEVYVTPRLVARFAPHGTVRASTVDVAICSESCAELAARATDAAIEERIAIRCLTQTLDELKKLLASSPPAT